MVGLEIIKMGGMTTMIMKEMKAMGTVDRSVEVGELFHRPSSILVIERMISYIDEWVRMFIQCYIRFVI